MFQICNIDSKAWEKTVIEQIDFINLASYLNAHCNKRATYYTFSCYEKQPFLFLTSKILQHFVSNLLVFPFLVSDS